MTENSVTTQHIENLFRQCSLKFHRFDGTTTTVCAVFLSNGFMLATGESSCVDPANFDEVIGKRIAASNAERKALDKLWELEGYVLKQKLDEQEPCQ